MYPVKLKPATKDYIWGGERLRLEYGVSSPKPVIAEAWMLSCNEAGASTIINGALAGKTLADALLSNTRETLGTNNADTDVFPILIKLIDAKEDLSIQVHPDNGYALAHGGDLGKTEMWYVLDAREDAMLYYGFSRAVTKEELRERILNNTVTEVLNRVPVKKGDMFFIEAGTIHAIGKGIVIAEIQQNSDTTYRVNDYDRTDAQGKKRELHIEKALDVTNSGFVPSPPGTPVFEHRTGYRAARLASCEFFTVDYLIVDTSAQLFCDGKSFVSLLFIEGNGCVRFENPMYGEDGLIEAQKGDSFFLPAGTGTYRIEGKCRVLVTFR